MRRTFLALWITIPLASAGCRPTPPVSFMPGLGEIMSLTQMRHVKLWFAGEAGNWPLADYELDELNEGLDDAASFHPTHKDADMPVPALIDKIMKEPIAQVRKAVQGHNQAAFGPAFDALTDGCNACHRAAKFDFNVVTRPTANPYTNQRFEPAK